MCAVLHQSKKGMAIQIDITAALRQKAPHTHFPKFVIRWLERIVHVKEMNAFLAVHTTEEGFDFARVYLQDGLQCSYQIDGLENLPTPDTTTNEQRPLLFVSNHPLGGLDGIILSLALGEKRNYRLRLIVNDLLMHLKPLSSIFVPVNKVGKQSREYAIRQQELWQSNMDILSFPAGACSRLQHLKGKGWAIADLDWQKSFIRHAVQYKRDIVPIRFDGKNSRFFYLLAYIRKLLHIQTNIEMLYLADEMYKAKGKTFSIRVGAPIPYTTFDNTRSPQEWAQWMKEKVYQL